MTTSIACASCGHALRDGVRFCTACGAPAPVVIDPAPLPATPSRGARRGGLAAAFDGVRTAGVGVRLLAYLVDALVVGAVAGCVALLAGRWALGVLVAAELAVGIVVWEARTGRTFGNALLGLRTARAETPYALGLGRAAGRALVLGAGHLVAVGQWVVVGSAGLDGGGLRQGWHDKAGRAVVVDVRGPRAAVPPGGAPRTGVATATAVPTPRTGERAHADPAGSTSTAVDHGRRAVTAAPSRPTSAREGWTPPAAVAPRTYLITLDTGQSMSVAGPGLVGRAPQVTPGERCDHLIAVDDPERSLSRTHARFGVDPRLGFWISDAGSGNGTIVVPPTGQSVVAPPDQRVPVPSGSTVRIGDRSFTVRAVRP